MRRISIFFSYFLAKTPFMCRFEDCKALFATKQKRDHHYYHGKHAETDRFMCDLCSLRFPTSTKLKYHLSTHSDERVRCPVEGCTVTLKQSGEIKNHMNSVHSDLRPFACEFCDLKFKIRNGLRSHRRRVHTKENMKSCEECGKLLLSVTQLNNHIAAHHRGERNFCCTICSKAYGDPKFLRRHYVAKHKDEYDEMVKKGIIRTLKRGPTNPEYWKMLRDKKNQKIKS